MVVSILKQKLIRASQAAQRNVLPPVDAARLEQMFAAVAQGEPLARPSRYWEELNRMNLAQLRDNGFKNFKRTIALNYYTWTMILPWDSQILFLLRHLPVATSLRCAGQALTLPRHEFFNRLGAVQSLACNFLSLLLWCYVLRLDLPERLLALREPALGNPPVIEPVPGMMVTQDLANSILEYDAFKTAIPATPVIVELGAGYGRNAFVVLHMHPDAKLIIVDIPPALWVAERYLSALFPEKKIFAWRALERLEDAAAAYAAADIVFLLSTQLGLVPAGSADLIINISSLHEMRPDQIEHYFGQFDRIMKCGGAFYTKQWLKARVLFEGVTLEEADYPVRPHWRKIFSRVARVQTKFFEALYRKEAPAPVSPSAGV